MTKQPESKLSHQIMEALRARGVFCFKVHGNEMMMSGLPDIIACVPIMNFEGVPVGVFVGLETKMPGNDLSARQRRVHELIRDAHGVAFRVNSVDGALAALQSIGWSGTTPDTV